jgi:hypothetical protein
VVQRAQVGELDHDRRLDHLGRTTDTELGRDGGQQWPEPLAARVHQVPRGLGDQWVVAVHGAA